MQYEVRLWRWVSASESALEAECTMERRISIFLSCSDSLRGFGIRVIDDGSWACWRDEECECALVEVGEMGRIWGTNTKKAFAPLYLFNWERKIID